MPALLSVEKAVGKKLSGSVPLPKKTPHGGDQYTKKVSSAPV
jgi:hypothetical protein